METWLCICEDEGIFNTNDANFCCTEFYISKLKDYVTLENYKKIKLMNILPTGKIVYYKLSDDARKFITDSDDIYISMPQIHLKLFPSKDLSKKYQLSIEEDESNKTSLTIKLHDTEKDKHRIIGSYNCESEKIKIIDDNKNKEYIVSFVNEPTKSMTIDEIGEHFHNNTDLSMKIYDPTTKKTYKYNENLHKFTEWNTEDIFPLDKYLNFKYKMIIYYPKDLAKPFELNTVESAEREMEYNANKLNIQFNKYCLSAEKEIRELVEKNNIKQIYKVLIIRNNKVCGKFDHLGYFYGDTKYASFEKLNLIYQKICNMCNDYIIRNHTNSHNTATFDEQKYASIKNLYANLINTHPAADYYYNGLVYTAHYSF